MRRHVIHLGGAPYITPSHTLAADFRTWGYPVDSYAPQHHNIHALLSMQRAEGFDQQTRESQLVDIWCAEWVGRWGFESRVGALLSEAEELGTGRERETGWDLGAALGLGRGSFTEGARATKVGRRRWGLEGVRTWFGGGVGRSIVEEGSGDEDVPPMYTKGEDPPAYEQ